MKNPFSSLLSLCGLFFLIQLCSISASAQLISTNNQFIHGIVQSNNGQITVLLPPGRLGYDGQLNFFGHSYFSCQIIDKVYTNNEFATKPANAGTGWQLTDGITEKVDDTIITTWTRAGINIIQEVYPIAFEKSGQIMMRWKFNNPNSSTPVAVACQYLNDIAISDPHDPTHPNGDDGPILFHQYAYRDAWQRIPSPAAPEVPKFYAAFLRDLPNPNPGVSAFAYLDNPMLGTVKPSRITIGGWDALSRVAFGIPSPDWPIGTSLAVDNAVLIEFPIQGVALKSTAVVGATTYGTGEFQICNGPIVGIISYPLSLVWNSKTNKYPNNPFTVDVYLLNMNVGFATGWSRIMLGNHLFIANPSGGSSISKSDSTSFAVLGGGVVSHSWLLKTDDANPCQNEFSDTFSINVTSSISPIATNCEYPINFRCDTTPIFPLPADLNPPLFDNGTTIKDHKYTINVHDADILDSGLKSITWAPSADQSKFIISINPPIKPCAMDKDDHIVTITQLDSLVEGCFAFAFVDCAGNRSNDIVCMPSAFHLTALPDTVNFGAVEIPSSKMRSTNIANIQLNGPVATVDSIVIHNTSQPVFQLQSAPLTPLQLQTTKSLPLAIQYSPITVASDTGHLQIVYHADGVSKKTASVLLIGNGINATGVQKKNSESFTIQVTPNPFMNEIRIHITSELPLVSAELYDVTGKCITLPVSNHIILDAVELGLQSGVYLLKVSNGKESVLRKIIKE